MPDIRPLGIAYMGCLLHIDLEGVELEDKERLLHDASTQILDAMYCYAPLKRQPMPAKKGTCSGHDTNCACDGGCQG